MTSERIVQPNVTLKYKIEVSNIKFQENVFTGSRSDTYLVKETENETEKHDAANRCFSRLRGSA